MFNNPIEYSRYIQDECAYMLSVSKNLSKGKTRELHQQISEVDYQ